MNRKTVIICTVVATVLLLGVGFLFFRLFRGNDGGDQQIAISDGVSTIPADAIFLLESKEFQTLKEMTDEGNAFREFFECIPDQSSEWRTYVSLHYSSKNKVDALFVLEIPESVDPDNFGMQIHAACRQVVNKKYHSYTIYKSTVPDISFLVYHNYLIASTSTIIVESSLRHLVNGNSLKDNPLYTNVTGSFSGKARLDINNQNLGKLFSGVISREYLRHAGFAQNFSDWTTFFFSDENGALKCDGRFYNERGQENFSNVFLSQKGKKSDLFSIVPFNANYAVSIPLTSYEAYITAYKAYIEANKKKKEYDYVNIITSRNHPSGVKTFEFLSRLEPKELALFCITDKNEKNRNIVAIRCDRPEAMQVEENTVSPYPYAGYLKAVLGEVFAPSSETHFLLRGDWMLVGSENDLSALQSYYGNILYFSLEEYLHQTPAVDEIRKPANFIAVVNNSRHADTLTSFLKDSYSGRLADRLGKKNFEFSFIHLQKIGTNLDGTFTTYSEDLTVLPEPEAVRNDKVHTSTGLVDDTKVEIFPGPYRVKNFKDGSTNYLEQLPNRDIRLLNSAKRPVWTVKFDGPICGTVRQIDYLKNNKLQMLFASGNRIHLLDRLGRKVSRFPLTLGKEVLLGPDVYDFSGKKDYSMLILHTDNTLMFYNLKGEKESWWSEISLPEKILALPELLEVDNARFWIVRTSLQTLIYNDSGLPVADFTKKKRLRKDSEVEIVSSGDVAVTTVDGRSMLLNLKNGTMRRR